MRLRNSAYRLIAFTLVEMMVVIAVIGILFALLLPILSHEKAQARRATCLNNLRQLDVGLRMYCDDSNDTSPTKQNARFGTQAWSNYRELMKTYVGINGPSSGQDKVFACPADEFYIGMTKTGAFLYNPYLVRSNLWKQLLFDYSSYGFNGGTAMRSFGYNASPGIGGMRLSSVNNPTKTVLLAEAPAFYPYSWHHQAPTSGAEVVDGGGAIFNNAENMVGFVDGHVSYIKIYWDTNSPNGIYSLALLQDPPAGYDYKWSGN